MADLTRSLTTLALPFFDQGVEKVYVTLHCNRLFVGRFPAARCRVCGGTPVHREMTSTDDVPAVIRSLQ